MKDTTTSVVPSAAWANWALSQALTTEHRAAALNVIADRFALLTSPSKCPVSFILRTDGGHWARGETLPKAASNVKAAGAGRRERAFLAVVLNDPAPEVTGDGGTIINGCAIKIDIGWVGTVGSLLGGAS